MKESEAIKEYSDRLINLANKVKLLGAELSDTRIVQKILVTLPEKFEATIASLENTKDLSNITLAELLNSLQAQEQRRLMRNEGAVEGALQARQQFNYRGKGNKQKEKKNYATSTEVAATNGNSSNNNKGGKYPACQHCGKKNHPHFKCWRKPMRCRKCHKLGHAEIICKEKGPQQLNKAQIADQQEEEQLFVATCFISKSTSSESWLIDSSCTDHMTHDEEIFRVLDRSVTSKVRIGNSDYLPAKGKGTVAIESYSGTKLISDVLYVPEIDQNLLSVGQFLENNFKLIFVDKKCVIFDPKGQEICQVKMRGKSFPLIQWRKSRLPIRAKR
ncbi:uncharacterized protein LOC132057968 [Lycium ferocissimum]|uniref:uncharacterized protein LOC132057968 n=1 Tax=Lycium ferocissimum TaxID=112874 RepID=UPI00281657B7|nr:uncharacterized protein LOC132057968 [Lycium ferocissimum]